MKDKHYNLGGGEKVSWHCIVLTVDNFGSYNSKELTNFMDSDDGGNASQNLYKDE